jgi:uncharacterized protein with ParB-like and HNH nuclease domain
MLKFMEGKNKKFIIPVYQRNYDWRVDNCRQLFNDLIRISEQNRKPHFFGSIVSLCTKKNIGDTGDTYEEEYIIIDGQQRITTLTLVMIAMIHILNSSDDETISNEQIKQRYLLSSDGAELKLNPVKDDKLALTNAFTQNNAVQSHITENYQYFLREFERKSMNDGVNLTRQAILDAIKRLEIVSIELGANDDPQMIFESLNSTGLNLTEADKIRNYMLMGMNTEKQETFYHNYWSEIEQLTGYNVSAFIRDYITYKNRRIPNISKVYIVFKEYVQGRSFDKNDDTDKKEAILKELLLFAGYYNKIINSAHANNEIHEYLAYINKLKCKIAYPILLEVFYYNDVNKKGQPVNISDAELLEILKTLETFLVRRHICGLPIMSMDGFLMIVGRDVLHLSTSDNEKYVNLFKRIISRPSVFPNNTEFRDSMFRANFNNMVNRFKLHCFERLENFGREERVALDGQTFEHIMPQTLSQEWRDELGNDYRTTHETYIHCIGNLTYTGYRKEMTNRPFNQKKTMAGGFNNSNLYLNEYIAKQDAWNQEKIIERSNLLINRAISVWPSVGGGPPPSRPERYYLDDDFDPTGSSLIAFGFSDDEKIPASNWVGFYKKATIRAYNIDTTGFREYLKNAEFQFGFIGSEQDAGEELNVLIEISDGVYLEGQCSAKTIISRVKQLYQRLNISTTGMYVLFQRK